MSAELQDEEEEELSTMDISPIWNILETHGVKLPDYITRLLQLTGYNNLQSLSKLDDSRLIEELEHYTTDNLDASDLAIPESKQKFYFNKETKKFCILPGHKHLIIDAAETVQRILQRAEDEFHTQQQQQSLEESPSSFSELDSTSSSNGTRTPGARSNKANSSRPPSVNGTSQITVEEERQSLTEHLLTWITRKVSTGQVQPFMPDIDYRVEVIRPKNNGPDLYTFVCLRCNTTLKAFKRSNGHKWNTANVCRHLSTVHCHPSLAPTRVNKRRQSKDRSLLSLVGVSGTTQVDSLSNETPADQDHLNTC